MSLVSPSSVCRPSLAWLFPVLCLLLTPSLQSKTSDWLSAPKPNFPPSALKSGTEGSVKLHIVLTAEGNVKRATVVRSSGSKVLDESAREALLMWKMKPAAVKPTDLTQGRDEIIEFRQEAALVARYQDRDAYFESKGGVIKANELSQMWLSAPFPQYPYDSRLHWEEGTVIVSLTIGDGGVPQNVHVHKGSGHMSLDDAAVRAVKFWRARKEYIGRQVTFPVTFKMGRRQ